MEVDVTDVEILGLNALLDLIDGDNRISFVSLTDIATQAALTGAGGPVLAPFAANLVSDSTNGGTSDGTLIQSLIRAAAFDNGTNVLSAPHILTSDNEQAEIRIGDNIPIVSGRRETASANDGILVNVDRKDIGVTLRVTPQISEGDALRLKIFQSISQVNEALTAVTGAATEVGVALSDREVENTVVVNDGETVVIGGLISERFVDEVNKVPWLGDIPFLGVDPLLVQLASPGLQQRPRHGVGSAGAHHRLGNVHRPLEGSADEHSRASGLDGIDRVGLAEAVLVELDAELLGQLGQPGPLPT